MFANESNAAQLNQACYPALKTIRLPIVKLSPNGIVRSHRWNNALPQANMTRLVRVQGSKGDVRCGHARSLPLL